MHMLNARRFTYVYTCYFLGALFLNYQLFLNNMIVY